VEDRDIPKNGELIEYERRFAELREKFEESEARVLQLESALWSAEEEVSRLKASELRDTEVREFSTDPIFSRVVICF
jgi:hypothetical protein